MYFESEKEMFDYINISMEAQADFFVHAMIDIIDSEIEESKKSA